MNINDNNIISAAKPVSAGQRVIRVGSRYFPVGIGGNYIPGSGSCDPIELPDVTVTADAMLQGVTAITKGSDGSPQIVTGTIQNGSVNPDYETGNIVVSKGYYDIDITIRIPQFNLDDVRIVGTDVVIPSGFVKDETYFTLPSADVNVAGGTVSISTGYISEDTEISITEAEVVETEDEISISEGYIKNPLSFPKSGQSAAVKYGYINDDGELQLIDISGETIELDGSATELDGIDMFNTGKAEPEYSRGAGTGSGDYSQDEIKKAMLIF